MGKKAGARAGSTALVLVGAAKPKKRKASKRDWTIAKTVTFLTALAETCNVTRAAEQAGVSTGSAYDRRKKDAGFRAGWAEAIATAYQRLELELLERSLNGTEKVVRRRDGSEELMRDYSNQTALALLRMHRDNAVETINEPPAEDGSGGWELGTLRASRVLINGDQVIGERSGAIAGPVGGTTVDTEARTTLDQILSVLRTHGLIST